MNVSIVGLGVVGTSVGLALKSASSAITVVGHDSDSERMRRARAMGAIDRSHWNLLSACDQADIIVLDVSLDELGLSLRALRADLEPSTVLIGIHSAQRAALAMATEALTATSRFVGGHIVSPTLTPTAAPSASLLAGATFLLVPAPDATEQAVSLATTLAEAAAAEPLFIDAAEHDGLMTAMALLPVMGGVALVDALSGEPGIAERRHLLTAELAALTGLAAAADAAALRANADLLAHWVDVWIERLGHWRQMLGTDGDALARDLGQVAAIASAWKRDPNLPTQPTAQRPGWRQMLLGGLGRHDRGS